MANENVKIIVQEVDETRPRGSGSSSDIVYVPGMCTDFVSAEYRNVPVLCSTVDEFESCFTKNPFRFVKTENYNGVQCNVGDYDKGYIYAKELLNAGLTVLYEAICPSTNALENTATFNTAEKFPLETNTRNVFDVTTGTSTEDVITCSFEGFPAYGKKTLILRAGVGVTGTIDDSVTVTPANTKIAVKRAEGSPVVQIEWNDLSAEDLEATLLNIPVTVSLDETYAQQEGYVGHFSLNLVDGDVSEEIPVAADALATFYGQISERLDNLQDKNEYTVKYITSGGYPTFIGDYSLAQKMLDVAANRGDAVALIDHIDDPHATLDYTKTDSVYSKANTFFKSNAEFGAMFTPWGDYTCATMSSVNSAYTTQAMPASFGYLLCLASAIKTRPNWLAMAGVTRGIVPNLQKLRTSKLLSNVVAENYQPKYGSNANNRVSINAITNVKPYGLTIWGNRTLKAVAPKGTTATNFLNTRNMMSDIKKLAYNTAKSLMFEQDSDALWLNFKSGVSPLLEQLKSGSGISDYKIIRQNHKYTDGRALTRGEMAAVIKIFPLYAIEYFEITVVVSDNDVAIS